MAALSRVPTTRAAMRAAAPQRVRPCVMALAARGLTRRAAAPLLAPRPGVVGAPARGDVACEALGLGAIGAGISKVLTWLGIKGSAAAAVKGAAAGAAAAAGEAGKAAMVGAVVAMLLKKLWWLAGGVLLLGLAAGAALYHFGIPQVSARRAGRLGEGGHWRRGCRFNKGKGAALCQLGIPQVRAPARGAGARAAAVGRGRRGAGSIGSRRKGPPEPAAAPRGGGPLQSGVGVLKVDARRAPAEAAPGAACMHAWRRPWWEPPAPPCPALSCLLPDRQTPPRPRTSAHPPRLRCRRRQRRSTSSPSSCTPTPRRAARLSIGGPPGEGGGCRRGQGHRCAPPTQPRAASFLAWGGVRCQCTPAGPLAGPGRRLPSP
jgi:hypothetical protein